MIFGCEGRRREEGWVILCVSSCSPAACCANVKGSHFNAPLTLVDVAVDDAVDLLPQLVGDLGLLGLEHRAHDRHDVLGGGGWGGVGVRVSVLVCVGGGLRRRLP